MAQTAAGDHNQGLASVNHMALRRAIGNQVFSVPVLARDSGDANDIQTTNAIDFKIGNQTYTKSALSGENATITSADDNSTTQADGTTCWYVYTLNSSGTVLCYKGADDETSVLPRIPPDECAFGLVKVVNASGSDFTLGTTDYNASSVTSTFYNVSGLPASPP